MRPHPVHAARTTDEQFLDLVCADDELLRAEFDAIIAAEWPTPPPAGQDHEYVDEPAHPRRPQRRRLRT
jgi:hypothetical protein